ncbi:hypothetical protein GQ651_02195 [Alphaproteobacteria bacterium GH1-50]|uniref:Uncharacterized protein n=1 Tax=Kangsaoukella pontilimi TaxID=2691042 RepID=A0A7C9IEI8_9RHOB|nr:hypothetical protein [Kangsaoukella pontilimi]MXQ06649.1 hypothetical protein [Kangsaoukella pontilimi]
MATEFINESISTLTSTLSGPVVAAFSLTLLGALAVGRVKELRHQSEAAERRDAMNALPRELLLPVVHRDPDHLARAGIIDSISTLVIAGDWQELSARISRWEARLEATPGGGRYHDIAIETCLAGLQNLIDEGSRKSVEDLEKAEISVERFVERHRETPDDHILAVLAARAHMCVAETCSADFWPSSERAAAWRRMAHHYLRAEAILSDYDPVAYMSPLLGGTIYRLALGMPDGGARLRPAFEDWIDLDPTDPAIYAQHGGNLLPERFGTSDEIRLEALKAERRTRETIGKGGYALFAIPVIEADETTRLLFEDDILAAGLMDLARLSGTQAEVNWAAACLAREAQHGSEERQAIMASAFDALVKRHLGVIYPRLWHQPLQDIRARLKSVFDADPTGPKQFVEVTTSRPRVAA